MVELLAALTITGLLAGVSFHLVDRATRFGRGMALILEERAQLAGAATVLRSALEGVAPIDGDLMATSDSAVSLSGGVGHAVACRVTPLTLDLPPVALASGAALTWWETAPQAADEVVVRDDGALAGALDDSWAHRVAASAQPLPNACAGTSYIDPVADAGKSGWRLTLTAALPPGVLPGAPLHVLRRQRFALYRSGSEWMLGWTEWNPGVPGWNVIQPLAGPLRPWAPPGAPSGLTLQWRDSTGTATIAPGGAPMAHAVLSVRGLTRAVVRMDGMLRGLHLDSLGARVAARNRR